MMNTINNLVKEIESRYIGATVRIHPVQKNNTTLTGVTIQLPHHTVSPCVYLESIKGIAQMSISEIADEVIKINASAMKNSNQLENLSSCITDFSKVAPMLTVHIVSINGNEKFLDNVVYEQFLDLAIVPYIIISVTKEGTSTTKISKELAKHWDVAESEIISIAKGNCHDYNCTPMGRIISELMGVPYDPEIDKAMPMYVITNESKINGASAICNERYMQNVANDLGDLLVLPSSIHEVIVVPLTDDTDINEMTAMVQEINGSEVKPEEQLSDHVYIYRKETGWEF